MRLRVGDPPTVDDEDVPQRMSAIDEDRLLEGIRMGTPDWAAIYLTFREAMHRTAQKVIGPDSRPWKEEYAIHNDSCTAHLGVSALDIVHEAISSLKAKGLPRDLATVSALRAYLVTTTRNAAIDAWRRGRSQRKDEYGNEYWVRREHSIDRPQTEDSSDEAQAEEIVDGDAEFADEVDDSVLSEELLSHLDVLTPNERHVYDEVVLKSRPIRDVALELKVTPQRISQLVGSGAKRLLSAVSYH